MADSDLPGLTALTGAGSATGDLVHVVDVSDTTFAADGTDKRMTLAELALGLITHGAIATDAEVLAGYQPLDSDLTAIAALTTTATGRSLLAAANAAAIRTIADSPSVAEAVLLNPATSGNRITGALTTTDALMFRVSGDTQDRLVVNANGTLEWGSGALAVDTNLYRSAVDTLKTDDAFVVAGALTAGAGSFTAPNSTTVGLTVKGGSTTPSNPSGDLQQWQNSAGTVLAAVRDQWNGTAKFVVDHLAAAESSAITFGAGFNLNDALNIGVGTTTGTKIGTATTQKIGFYNATPVAQGASVADATDAATAITQLNALISRIEALGLIATV